MTDIKDTKDTKERNFLKETITITFGDRGENHVGNQKIGQLSSQGFTFDDLLNFKSQLNSSNVEFFNLSDYLPSSGDYQKINAGLLVIRDGLNLLSDGTFKSSDLWSELTELTYDKKALMYGEVRNKKARHNLCFADFDQEASYSEGKGTIIDFKHLPNLSYIRNRLPVVFGDKAKNLIGEANYYYDVNKCGIGYHGDAERKIVVGLRVGASMPLCYYWYHKSKRISERIKIDLNGGDVYIMDEKTCGCDFKKKSIITLRHAAGCDSYIK